MGSNHGKILTLLLVLRPTTAVLLLRPAVAATTAVLPLSFVAVALAGTPLAVVAALVVASALISTSILVPAAVVALLAVLPTLLGELASLTVATSPAVGRLAASVGATLMLLAAVLAPAVAVALVVGRVGGALTVVLVVVRLSVAGFGWVGVVLLVLVWPPLLSVVLSAALVVASTATGSALARLRRRWLVGIGGWAGWGWVRRGGAVVGRGGRGRRAAGRCCCYGWGTLN